MLLASLYTVGRGCHRDEHGSGRKGEEGFQGAHVLPEAGLCSLFSTLLPLQWLGQAWCVLKLTQLSGGLFLAQSALYLTAAQRALLSCCPGCC